MTSLVSENSTEITCKPSSWFVWRGLLMVVMFLGFGGYFYYDGAVGYKKKNADFYNYSAKSRVKELFKLAEVERGNEVTNAKSPASSQKMWEKFAANYQVELFEKRDSNVTGKKITDIEGTLPDGYAFPQKLPKVFVDSYVEMSADINNIESIWKTYAAENGLSESCSEYFKSRSEISAQFNWAIGAGVLGLIALFFLLRTLGRSMKVTDKGYTAPGGKYVPFDSIIKIDKRKWSRKGLAWLYYKDSEGGEKKVKVDGMVYGQFDKENPHNAEVLYQQIEASVTDVELIDFEEDDDEDIDSDKNQQVNVEK